MSVVTPLIVNNAADTRKLSEFNDPTIKRGYFYKAVEKSIDNAVDAGKYASYVDIPYLLLKDIKGQLEQQGYIVNDTPSGTSGIATLEISW